MAQQHLDLFQFTTCGPAALRARAPSIVRRNPRDAGRLRRGKVVVPFTETDVILIHKGLDARESRNRAANSAPSLRSVP